MKKIYLLSGPSKKGFSKKIKEEFKKDFCDRINISFITSSPNNHEKNLKYIYGNDDTVGIIKHLEEIVSIGDTKIIDDKNTKLDLNSDIIYFLGGDYKSQLDFIKRIKIDKTIKKYNGIIIATSCGAMNIAKKGYYSKDDEINNSFIYEGIDLVDITIDPHFDCNNENQIQEAKKMSYNLDIYGVPNTSGIKYENGSIKYMNSIFYISNGIMKKIN